MTPTVRLGRVGGVPLAAHWSALVVPLLIADALGASILPSMAKGQSPTAYWVTAVLVALAFLASLAAHEVAHAVTAVRRGLPVAGITLWMLGGVTAIEEEPKTPRDDLVIAAVGPLTSLVCGGLAALAALGLGALGVSSGGTGRVAVVGLVWLAASNGLLAVFNMLPGAPLDGGRVLRAWMWRRTGDRRRAELSSTRAGRVTGLALVGAGGLQTMLTGDLLGGIWLMLIGWFLMSSATAEAGAVETEDALRDLTVGAVMDARVTPLPSYQAADVAARRAVEADVDFCPVHDFDGRLVGVVDINDLVRAARLPDPPRVAAVTRALDPKLTTAPDEPLTQALHRSGRRLPLVALDSGMVVGLVTAATVDHALRRRLLLAEPVG
jgi:Zn-dependent protease/CBS domain-containing protein